MKKLFIIFTMVLATAGVYAQKKEAPADSVYLFTDKNGVLAEDTIKSQRQLSPKYLQITNFAGKSIPVKLSLDLNAWASFSIKSPEKKVFTCPAGVNQLYLIIDPEKPNAVKTIINRSEKYELYYNKSTKLYDIMKKEKDK